MTEGRKLYASCRNVIESVFPSVPWQYNTICSNNNVSFSFFLNRYFSKNIHNRNTQPLDLLISTQLASRMCTNVVRTYVCTLQMRKKEGLPSWYGTQERNALYIEFSITARKLYVWKFPARSLNCHITYWCHQESDWATKCQLMILVATAFIQRWFLTFLFSRHSLAIASILRLLRKLEDKQNHKIDIRQFQSS